MSFTEDITIERLNSRARIMSDELLHNYLSFAAGIRDEFQATFVLPRDPQLFSSDRQLTHEEACLRIHELALENLLGGIRPEQYTLQPNTYRGFGGVIFATGEITFGDDVDYYNLGLRGSRSELLV